MTPSRHAARAGERTRVGALRGYAAILGVAVVLVIAYGAFTQQPLPADAVGRSLGEHPAQIRAVAVKQPACETLRVDPYARSNDADVLATTVQVTAEGARQPRLAEPEYQVGRVSLGEVL